MMMHQLNNVVLQVVVMRYFILQVTVKVNMKLWV